MSREEAPYRQAELTTPEPPPLRLGWQALKEGLASAALFWMVAISTVCVFPLIFAMVATGLSWSFWALRKSRRRQQALRTMFVLAFPCLVGVSMLVSEQRGDRIEAAAIAEAREFRRVHRRYPTRGELSVRVRGLTPVGTWLNDVSYIRSSPDYALVIRKVMTPFWRRVTRVSSGVVYYLD